ncbi:MAG: acetyl-CoA carboxylase, carboxyltransferase subunit beta [Candidatus Omnitrophota bacterium]
MPLFGNEPKYRVFKIAKRKSIPDGLWTKCPDCGEIIFNKKLEENLRVCTGCNYHFTLTAQQRIKYLFDRGSFEECYANLTSADPLHFAGPKTYKDKLKSDQIATGMKSAAIAGKGSIGGHDVICCVTDSRFIMGSMGAVVGEKITRSAEKATASRLPFIIVSGSGGGARMYEGMLSLMQMAKTSAALARHSKAGLLFISLLTNPTMAGVLASFASLGDIIAAEPKALIGFTGPRVIEQTIRQKLPEGFQKSEFLIEHGLIDIIIDRKELSNTISRILEYSQ